MLGQTRSQKAYILLAAVVLVVLVAFPYVVMLLTSLKGREEIFAIPPTFFPREFVFANFLDVWSAVPLATFLLNSVLIASGSTIVALTCAVPAAYGLSRTEFVGKRLFLYAVIITQIFSPIVLIVGLFREMVWFGLTDSLPSLILVNAAFSQAFAIWLLYGYFSTIPLTLEEAAWLDGCSRFSALRRVVLPLALPGLVTTVIFVFIHSWNEFIVALTLIITDTKKPLTVGIYSFIGRFDTQWAYVFASSILASVPVIVLFLAIERYLVSGLTSGGVKE
jgi:multiple sugar transport system permease protein